MKISARQYANALFEAVRGKKEGEVKVALKNFVGILAEKNDFKKAPEIIRELIKVYRKEEGIIEAEIISAEPLKKELAGELREYIKKASGAEKVELKEITDSAILGGVVIKFEDKIIDGSLRMRLSELKVKMAE
jgi:F-type H+-transporting ATPase subunit delta